LSHIQIYTKCTTIIPEIEERLENEDVENVKDYVKSIYKELSILSLASFMDSLSSRNIKSEE
jgi:HPt (histidine-containing phosphotransfer) domain-containing protein